MARSVSFGVESSDPRSVFVGTTTRRGILSFDVSEKRFDAGGPRDGVVFLELDFGCNPELKRARYARAQMRGNAVEPIERRLLLGITTENTHVDARVPQIGADFGSRDGHESDDARILCRFCEECRNLDADRFGDAVRSTRVTQKRPPPKSMSLQPAPCDNTRARRRL